VSAKYDYPTGAAIVCALGAALLLTGMYARLRDRTGHGNYKHD
jgi:hypothetical protein